ncbi:hypothetical protein F5Y03DRAFT_119060 [Xylaria venustula]|nr:hypothetical protein F5Y03DRAFT_119060 [Xylaria venustula]
MSILPQTTLGFTRQAQQWRWLLASGTLAIFSVISLRFLDFDSVFCPTGPGRIGALPGECFYFTRSSAARLGIKAHLWCVLPAGILAAIQFVPVVRRPPLARIHRVSGYLSIALGLVGSVAALPTIRYAFGGDLASQSGTSLLLLIFVVAQVAGYICIRRGDIQHHRQWMLRSWFYAGSVITMRIIMTLGALSITLIGGYYLAMPCDKVNSILKSRGETMRWYPECLDDPQRRVIVDADVFAPNKVPFAAAFNLSYGMSSWLSIFSHVVGVELYIQSKSPRRPGAVSDKKSR